MDKKTIDYSDEHREIKGRLYECKRPFLIYFLSKFSIGHDLLKNTVREPYGKIQSSLFQVLSV